MNNHKNCRTCIHCIYIPNETSDDPIISFWDKHRCEMNFDCRYKPK